MKLRTATLDVLAVATQPARRPEPLRLCIEREIDRHDWDIMERAAPGQYAKRLKADMVAELAKAIGDSKLFALPNLLGNDRVCIELTINDAGAYQGWLPQERREGQREGAERERKRAPYGFEPDQFYE